MTTNKNRTIKTDYPKPNIYSVKYSCANCGWAGLKKFDVGKLAPSSAICTRCGCPTAKKSLAVPYVPKRPPEPDCPPMIPAPGPRDPWRDNRWWPPNLRMVPLIFRSFEGRSG